MKISDQAVESASHIPNAELHASGIRFCPGCQATRRQRQGIDAVIPPEVIEAAAKAYRDYPTWKDLHEDGREWRREYVRAAIEVAAPSLKAEAYDEGYKAGTDEFPWQNPYRAIKPGRNTEEG